MARFTARKYEEHSVSLAYRIVIAAIIGARFWQVFLFEPAYYMAHPTQIVAIWNGGLGIQVGIVGGLIAGVWYCRRHHIPFWELADLLAPAIILGQGLGRIACLLNGEAFGSPTGGNFGLVYPPGTIAYSTFGSQPLWPAEVWEGQADMVIFAILLALLHKKMPSGALLLMYNILYSLARFALEFLRGDSPRYAFAWTAAQWTSADVIIVCATLLVWLFSKARTQASRRVTVPDRRQ